MTWKDTKNLLLGALSGVAVLCIYLLMVSNVPLEAQQVPPCAQWTDSTAGSPPVGFIIIEMSVAEAIDGDLAELYRVDSEDPVTNIASSPIHYQASQCLAVVVGLNQ
jgi:hypothetical protein